MKILVVKAIVVRKSTGQQVVLVGSNPTRATKSHIEVPISKLFLVKIKFTSRDLFKCSHGAIDQRRSVLRIRLKV